jgi:uncharacterized lipoprotein YehR (DUF1307 family)
MKKIITLFTVLILTIFLVSGCTSNKKIVSCHLTEEEDEVTITTNLKFTYKNDKPENMSYDMSFNFKQTDEEGIQFFYEMFDEIYNDLAEQEGFTYESKLKDDQLKILVDIDFNKAKKLDSFSNIDITKINETSIDDLINNLEQEGFTCD